MKIGHVKKMQIARSGCAQLLMATIAVVYFFPVYIMISTSLKTMQDYFQSPIGLPTLLNFDNYVRAWNISKIYLAYKNSLILTVSAVLVLVLVGSMAAFPLARMKHKLAQFLFTYFVAGIMLPFQTGMVPLVKILKDLHLLNTKVGAILVFAALNMPITIFLYSSFLKEIPMDIEESAMIDGCNKFQIFWRIIFPLVRPATATVILLTSLGIWNDFLVPLLLLGGERNRTVPQAVYVFFGRYFADWGPAFAVLVMAMIPIIGLFLMVQKEYIKGIVAGAVKG